MVKKRLGSLDPASGHVHLIGIGGAGNNVIAEVLVAAGYRVSGSDAVDSPTSQRLRGLGVEVSIGHHRRHVSGADCVVYSAAIQTDNPEMTRAAELGIPVVPRGRFLADMLAGTRLLAIAGTHGKTTTSGMAATILMSKGRDPTFLVGSDIANHGSGARLGSSELAVVEADEAYGSFLWLAPSVAVVTSVDEDHLDHYGDLESLHRAFQTFMHAATEAVLVCADHPVATSLAPAGAILYGSDPRAAVRAVDITFDQDGSSRFGVAIDGDVAGTATVRVPGAHNVLNGCAAIAGCMHLGLSFEEAAEGLASFTGTARRFERKGSIADAEFFDDYAHHPAEIAATIAAARLRNPDRLIVVFQPHLFSRTASLGPQMGSALSAADLVLVTDIYPAREAPVDGVTGEIVAKAVSGTPVEFVPEMADAAAKLLDRIGPGDLVLSMGAGDIGGLFDLMRSMA